ncbi:hypothetical protein SteCoe_36480 [Stentor coeruleus]|uniref:Uncharacterized protein n=1 Tax=Stentor coeruleus TaxID=5963 RepID=A0A1R2AQ14_9CILI|nr:hypothetical protein SteCoe_36480 [Stentor coeruleus]
MSLNRLNFQEFIPMQEIAESIYEVLSSINNLSIENPNDELTYEYLLRKVKSQAFCMQGVVEDLKFKRSIPFQNLKNIMNLNCNDEKVHPFVRSAIHEIIPIFDGEVNIEDSITFNKIQPSNSVLRRLQKSIDYINERFNQAESDPISYIRSCKIPLFTENEYLDIDKDQIS